MFSEIGLESEMMSEAKSVAGQQESNEMIKVRVMLFFSVKDKCACKCAEHQQDCRRFRDDGQRTTI